MKATLDARDKAWRDYKALVTAGEEQQLAAQIESRWNAYAAIWGQIQAMLKKGDRDGAMVLNSGGNLDAMGKLREAIEADVVFDNKGADVAGKGFAVVASEVKALANQTAKATDEISGQIGQIQDSTKQAVEAIRGIAPTIGEIADIATAIAAAVEQQGSATKEIARNVQQTAQGTHEVASNIVRVKEASVATGSAASQVLSAAGALAQQAQTLSREVDSFLSGVKAA